ncbi:MAG: Hsp20/alpha crystallin family protein [Vicingaceae bacterium]
MKALFKITPFFERSIDEILQTGFFNSLDSNIIELENCYLLEISVPGMDKKDLEIELDNSLLTVTGNQQKNKQHIGNKLLEFNRKKVKRSFFLPKNIALDKISAQCKNGLLEITIPKLKASTYHKKIPVKGSVVENKNKWFTPIFNFFKFKKL